MSHKGKIPVRPTIVLPSRENIHGLYEKYSTISCQGSHSSVPPRMSQDGRYSASVQLWVHAYDATAAIFVVVCSVKKDPRRSSKELVSGNGLSIIINVDVNA